jgi:hypothetical protein
MYVTFRDICLCTLGRNENSEAEFPTLSGDSFEEIPGLAKGRNEKPHVVMSCLTEDLSTTLHHG